MEALATRGAALAADLRSSIPTSEAVTDKLNELFLFCKSYVGLVTGEEDRPIRGQDPDHVITLDQSEATVADREKSTAKSSGSEEEDASLKSGDVTGRETHPGKVGQTESSADEGAQ